MEAWLAEEAVRHPELLRFGYFGSYARNDWGVGSDLDLVALVAAAPEPFERRALTWRTEDLPVPSELLVYTEAEWSAMTREGRRFAATLARETVWVWPK
ncbi:MAG: nucleotidyltransferase domain-containing protein [Deferrisomatales bacterium]|nr:nucleotidyltransferase domain-containing protein [Deferrisomatales bacterium]